MSENAELLKESISCLKMFNRVDYLVFSICTLNCSMQNQAVYLLLKVSSELFWLAYSHQTGIDKSGGVGHQHFGGLSFR